MHPLHSMYSLVATSKLKMAYLGVSTSTIYVTVIGTYLQRFLTVYASPFACFSTALSLVGPRTTGFERHQTVWTCCCWSEHIAQCHVFVLQFFDNVLMNESAFLVACYLDIICLVGACDQTSSFLIVRILLRSFNENPMIVLYCFAISRCLCLAVKKNVNILQCRIRGAVRLCAI